MGVAFMGEADGNNIIQVSFVRWWGGNEPNSIRNYSLFILSQQGTTLVDSAW